MPYFFLGVFLGFCLFIALYCTAHSEYGRQLVKSECVLKEKTILLNFMHSLYDGISYKLDMDAVYQRIVHGSRISTLGASARFFRYDADTKELVASAKEGAFPLFKTKVRPELSKAAFLSLLNKGETFFLNENFIGRCAQDFRTYLLGKEDLKLLVKNSASKAKIKQLLISPILFKNELFGIIVVVNSMQSNGFSSEICGLLRSICEQAGIVLNNVRQLQRLFESQKLKFDLEIANHIQMYLLPQAHKLAVKGVEMHIKYKPSQKIGGDFYDLVVLDPDRTVVIIGDVAGHGISAALVMARILSYIRHYVPINQRPSNILKFLNQVMYGTMPEHLFITMLCAIIDTKNNTIEFSRAGHEYPLFIHDKRVLRLRVPGMALGLMPSEIFDGFIKDFKVPFLPGDTFMLFTDGLTESRNFKRMEFSNENLKKSILSNIDKSVEDINENIVKDVLEYMRNKGFSDDYTLMTFRNNKNIAKV